jgi:hypothetical protein
VTLPGVSAGKYLVGFSLTDPLEVPGTGGAADKYAVRFTNAESWANGVNVVGTATLVA